VHDRAATYCVHIVSVHDILQFLLYGTDSSTSAL
jgi:hypothetical protein